MRPLIETRRDLVEKNPDLVQRFVDASAIGWYHYLYGDNAKANEAIKKDNPEMTDEQIAFSIAKLKEYGIVDSGDTLKLGIGAMTDARVKDFFDKMVKAGIVKADTDYKKAYTLQFVNKGVGARTAPEVSQALRATPTRFFCDASSALKTLAGRMAEALTPERRPGPRARLHRIVTGRRDDDLEADQGESRLTPSPVSASVAFAPQIASSGHISRRPPDAQDAETSRRGCVFGV